MAPTAVRFVFTMLALAAAFVYVAPALATTVIPVPEAQLARGAVAIVIGHVHRIETHWDAGQRRIVTDVTLAIDEFLKGQLPVTELTLRHTGGRVGGVSAWIHGNPEFERGEKVLVFVARRPDGALRVAHLFQGKLSVITDPATGEEHVHREARPAGVNVIGGGQEGARITARLAEMKARVRSHLRGAPARRDDGLPVVSDVAAPSTAIVEEHDDFTFLGSPSRWFEADAGQTIPIRINSGGEPLASGSGFGQVRAGYAAWNAVTGSGARFVDAGFTAAGGYQLDGVNSVSFRDPNGEIDPPSGCAGTLAIGGYFRSGEAKTVNGQSFYRIVEGDVVFADGWAGCDFYESFNNLAEVATHELGHVLGLGHSTDADAIMTAYAHFGERGARLGSDDIAAVRFAYPAATPSTATLSVVRSGGGTGTVTASPAGITCGSDCAQPYALGTLVTLTAVPASGSTFAGWSGAGCTGMSTCRVTINAATTVTATFTAGTPTPATGLTASFSAPATGATVKNSVSVGMASNQWGTSKTFTLSVDGAVIATKTTTGTTFWFSWNTTGVANGAHTLKLTVSTASGSATATRAITVGNGTATPAPTPTPTPASFTAAFSAPAAGTSVDGTVSVGMSTTAPWGQSKTWTLKVDGATVKTITNTGTVLWHSVNTLGLANGTHTLTVSVTFNGATATATRAITIAN